MKHLEYSSEICLNRFLTRDVRRRSLFQLAAASTLSVFAETNAHADVPIPKPFTLEERIKFSRWVFTGTLRRIVYLSPATVKKLFTPGAVVEPSDLQLYEQEDQSEAPTAFLEIEEALPIFRRATIPEKDEATLPKGTVYVRSGPILDADYKIAIAALQGKKVILFMDRERKQFGVHANLVFPKPMYYSPSSGGNWRSGVPLPIEALPDVMRVGLDKGLLQRLSLKR